MYIIARINCKNLLSIRFLCLVIMNKLMKETILILILKLSQICTRSSVMMNLVLSPLLMTIKMDRFSLKKLRFAFARHCHLAGKCSQHSCHNSMTSTVIIVCYCLVYILLSTFLTAFYFYFVKTVLKIYKYVKILKYSYKVYHSSSMFHKTHYQLQPEMISIV